MSETMSLESLELGAQPLLGPFITRLHLRRFFQESLGKLDSRLALSPVDSALVILRNFTLSRHPLYGVPEWVRRFDPAQLDLDSDLVGLINDDRFGRTLDRFFQADLRSLMTRIVVHMVSEFGLETCGFHNDSTSISFSGIYAEKPPRRDGRRRLRIVHGHNKDHRPDLKQLVWSLTVSEDGAVPVHYNVYDGNVTDDRTHIETWDVLRQIVGNPRFLYVADSKLCTKEQMAYIHNHGGQFITVMPRTRKENAYFKEWILLNPISWKEIWVRPPARRKTDPPDRFEAVEAPQPSADGYRIVWFRSSEKWKRDERARDNAIHQTRMELHQLRERVGVRQLKTRQQVADAVEKILEASTARAFLHVELVEQPRHVHKQVGRGRPGKNTSYVRQTKLIYEPVVTINTEKVLAAAAADGIFPLMTNLAADQKTALDILVNYKHQAFIEKRHEQLKTAAEVVPVNFKSPERIEAFLFFYFLALVLHSLIERQVRYAMSERKIPSVPLYPEERECKAPTADKILAAFAPLRRHRLKKNGRVIQTFHDELSEVQREILDLLNIPFEAYGSGA